MNAEMLETVLSAVVPAIALLLAWSVKLLTEVVRAKTEELKKRTSNETVKTYIDLVSENALNVVQALNQTLVEELRSASADGKLTADDAMTIKNKAVNMLADTLSDDIKEIIQKTFGDTETYLMNVVEKTVCSVKNSNSAKG